MTVESKPVAADPDSARPAEAPRLWSPVFVAMAVLFFLSGCAALTYEVVWFQLLRLTVGASSISLAMTLAAFMGGLGLGAWFAPRLVRGGRSALWVYVWLELGIGVCGLAMPWAVPWVSRVYAGALGHGVGVDLSARAVVCGLVLLPPTVLMGATLPVVARWLGSSRRGMAGVSWLYAINTFGAVAGTLLAGFVWLRFYSTWTASFIAVGLNLAVAVIAGGIALREGARGRGVAAQDITDGVTPSDEAAGADAVAGFKTRMAERLLRRRGLVVIALSGLTALGAQVLWTRATGLLLAVTVYTFAIILAAFLAGLALGSAAGAAAVRRTRRPGLCLALTQLGLVLAIAWAFYAIDHHVLAKPGPGRGSRGGSADALFSDFVRVAWAVFPATVLWGASFPFALALGRRETVGGERWVARVYAANTAGAIVGALGFTFVGFALLGSNTSAHVLTALPGVGALLVLRRAALWEPVCGGVCGGAPKWRLAMPAREVGPAAAATLTRVLDLLHRGAARRAALPVIAVGVTLLATLGPGVPTDLLVYGHYRQTRQLETDVLLAAREGLVAPAGVVEKTPGVRELFVSGKVVASSLETDMRLQRMLGHLATLTHGQPKSVLIVGMGTGTTAGSFVLCPTVERIVICEIEPRVLELAGEFFAQENHRVLEDPRTAVVIDDARHYLATTDEKFDVITSDPIHPWVKGASALYSKQYYALVRQRLNPGGVVTQWVPFYETSDAAARSMLATFFGAFPEGTVWHAGAFGKGQDVVMLGHPDRQRLDLDAWAAQLDGQPEVLADLIDAGIEGVPSLLSRFTAHAQDLGDWLDDAAINHDDSLRLEYLAGLGLFNREETTILRELESRRRWPHPRIELNLQLTAEVERLYAERRGGAADGEELGP